MGQFSLAELFGMTIRESANDGSDFTNPAADYRRLFLGEDGLLHVKDSAGAVTDPYDTGGGSGQGLVDFAKAKYTGGDITCSANAVWADLQNALDLTLTAATSDIVEVGLSLTAPNTTAVSVNLTAVSIVSAAPVNDFATDTTPSDSTDGVSAWRVGSSTVSNAGGSILYTLQSGDISGGTVTIRFRYRTSSSTDRVVSATTAQPIHVWAKNLGPAM